MTWPPGHGGVAEDLPRAGGVLGRVAGEEKGVASLLVVLSARSVESAVLAGDGIPGRPQARSGGGWPRLQVPVTPGRMAGARPWEPGPRAGALLASPDGR